MLFKAFRENRYVLNHVKISLADLSEQLKRLNNKLPLAICVMPTGNSWQGVATATEGLFKNVFYIPHYFSTPVYSTREFELLGDLLGKSENSSIVFSGYLPHFEIMIKKINRVGKPVQILYHGSHSSVLEDPNAATHFKSLIDFSKRGLISKVGFVKKDMHIGFEKLTGLKAVPILLKTNESLVHLEPNKYDELAIGVLTHDGFRKNIYNMYAAALQHPTAKVHVKQKYLSDYLGQENRFVVHGHQNGQTEFWKILGGMAINFYVTYSECWGQYINESLAMGIPCLTSDVSAVLDFDTDLKELLIVREFDNDYAIFKQSEIALEAADLIKVKGPQYIQKVNLLADDYLTELIN